MIKEFFQAASVLVVVGLLLNYLFPWWFLPIGCFAVGFIFQLQSLQSFFCGASVCALLWGGHIYILNSQNEGLLAGIMTDLLPFSSVEQLIGVSIGLIAFLGGLSMLSGQLGRDVILGEKVNKKKKRYRGKYS